MVSSGDKETRKLIKRLEEQGWEVKKLKNGHHMAMSPNGKDKVTFGNNTFAGRSLENTIASLRRAGADL